MSPSTQVLEVRLRKQWSVPGHFADMSTCQNQLADTISYLHVVWYIGVSKLTWPQSDLLLVSYNTEFHRYMNKIPKMLALGDIGSITAKKKKKKKERNKEQ